MAPCEGKRYLINFMKAQYYVPESAIVSLPKKANTLPDAETLGKVLATKGTSGCPFATRSGS